MSQNTSIRYPGIPVLQSLTAIDFATLNRGQVTRMILKLAPPLLVATPRQHGKTLSHDFLTSISSCTRWIFSDIRILTTIPQSWSGVRDPDH
ncbi:hypothetical protein TNCV_1804141 [Trichonephila clavipes]|nr:hypothetical protein TNCV_1804141 [Trichonephila clavipes]